MKGKELFKKKKDTEKEEFFDAPLFEYIQPQGGITLRNLITYLQAMDI